MKDDIHPSLALYLFIYIIRISSILSNTLYFIIFIFIVIVIYIYSSTHPPSSKWWMRSTIAFFLFPSFSSPSISFSELFILFPSLLLFSSLPLSLYIHLLVYLFARLRTLPILRKTTSL